ncbi:hypothetical protein [Opacimonas viscosa]|uniref:PKD domain-containing protein n=1 Tax=Opacimonas viscosa TaxID=2961944 RepID=A0AA42BKV6_9ALTE|nr:hypothetical protein [Opacimonas viscosa]MCP3428125.1 hypothetical protein [Opacimonas viscosa]
MKKFIISMLAISILALSQTSFSATFNVANTPEFRDALKSAATNGENDTIILADGIYKTTDDGEGTFIYLSQETNTLTLQGSIADNVIISGDNTHRVFHHYLNSAGVMSNALTIKKISFVDGFTDTNSYGAGVFTAHDVVVIGCIFKNNDAQVGLKVMGNVTSITDSQFLDNKGGGVLTYSSLVTVSNSMFINNSSIYSTGAISQNKGGGVKGLFIEGTLFKDNSSIYSNGGAISAMAPTTIKNSIFTGNSAPRGGAIASQSITVLNSIFHSNTKTLQVYSNAYVVNSIFDGDVTYSIGGSGDALIRIYNSFFNPLSLDLVAFEENNIFTGVNLGFVDAENGNFHLTDSSDLINAGTVNIDDIDFPKEDLDGKYRISGAAIDIGPYEYPSTTPTISSFSFIGDTQEQSELVFNAEYDLADGRNLQAIEYDFGNGFVTEDNFTFNTSGVYSVMVKITDNTGEFSTSALDVTISELPWTEMTFEQRLVKAIPPEYYEDIQQGIILERSEASVSGRLYVQDNPSEFSLVSIEALAPSESTVNELTLGWSLISTSSAITELTMFSDVKVIWIYVDGAWQGWSSDKTILQQIELDENYKVITSIPNNSGIWVLK